MICSLASINAPNTVAALGFFVTLYATLITLFGLAWVLFLIGKSTWILVEDLMD